MSKSKLAAAVAIPLAVILATGVFAQDRQQRRQRLREGVEAAVGIGAQVAEEAMTAGFKGTVIILQEPATGGTLGSGGLPNQEVNNGGMVIVEVPDTQSRPTSVENPVIEPEASYRRMGKVHGDAMEHGKPLTGGARTWFILKPVKEGPTTIRVAYTPNGGGEPVSRIHKVTVTAGHGPGIQGRYSGQGGQGGQGGAGGQGGQGGQAGQPGQSGQDGQSQ